MSSSDGGLFSTVIIGAFLLPWTWAKLRACGASTSEPAARGGGVFGDAVRRKSDKLRADRWRASLSFANCIYLALLYAMANACASVRHNLKALPMLPHEVLGVTDGAPHEDIRAAYRRLSLRYHPDKAGGDLEAPRKFLEVSRAYAILTDPAARRNYERYGNPDGYNGMQVDFGLPAWALDRGEGGARVALLALALVLAIPFVAMRLLAPSQRQRDRQAVCDKLRVASAKDLRDRVLSPEDVLELAACGAAALPALGPALSSRELGEASQLLLGGLSAPLRARLGALGDTPSARAAVLLHALSARASPSLEQPQPSRMAAQACLAQLQAQLPLLLECLAALVLSLSEPLPPSAPAARRGAAAPKQPPAQARPSAARRLEAVLRATQRLVQALPLEPPPEAEELELLQLLQLPHVDLAAARALLAEQAGPPPQPELEAEAEAAAAPVRKAGAKKRGGKGAVSAAPPPSALRSAPAPASAGRGGALRALCSAAPAAARARLLGCGLSPAQAEDALGFLARLPDPVLALECEVADEERVEVGDMLTVRAVVRAARRAAPVRESLHAAPEAHAPWVHAAVPELFSALLLNEAGQLLGLRQVHLSPLARPKAGETGAAAPLAASAGGLEASEGFTAEWLLKAPASAGQLRLEVRIVCHCYLGLDSVQRATVQVHSSQDARARQAEAEAAGPSGESSDGGDDDE